MCAATVAAVTAIAGTAYGAYSSNQQAQAAKAQAKKGSQTDQTTTTTSSPYGPTTGPRQTGLDEAMKLFNSGGPKYNPYRPTGGGPSAATTNISNDIIKRGLAGSPTAKDANSYLQSVFSNPTGPTADGKKSFASMTDADVPAWAKASGVSGYQDYLRSHPDAPGNKQFGDSPAGNPDPNSTYNPELYKLMNSGAPDNPYLKQFLDKNINTENNPGAGDNGGTTIPSGGGRSNMSGWGASGMVAGPNGSATPGGAAAKFVTDPYVKEVMDGKFLNEGNPYTQKLIDGINAQITKSYNENTVPTINASANAHGRFGSDTWAGLQANASGQFAQNLGTADSQVLQSDYESERARMMQAMGISSQDDIAKMNDATQRYGISSSAAASGAATAASLQSALDEHNIARQQNLLSAIGQYGTDQNQHNTYLAGLAGQLSSDRNAALAATPSISNLDLNDMQTALGTQKGLDAARNAAAGNKRAYDINKWNFEQNAPYNNLSNLGKFINEFGGGYGTTESHTQGTNVVPMNTPSVAGATLGGGLAGYQTGTDLGNAFQAWYNNRQASPQGTSTNLPTYPTPTDTSGIHPI